ncbi:hypothetical protein HRI_004695500 [Hibiscus trionum]|uniref:Uncharacterized protein n=1 Tax=Hibiscus trionum TaxID=183268 RepID=A0A9W7J8X5_HIBTR|nr:hypothetical protein HRI_004695500 [Hibiscus trionum]
MVSDDSCAKLQTSLGVEGEGANIGATPHILENVATSMHPADMSDHCYADVSRAAFSSPAFKSYDGLENDQVSGTRGAAGSLEAVCKIPLSARACRLGSPVGLEGPDVDIGDTGLHDVPIRGDSISLSSSGHSVSLEPVFDEVTGLYSVKTKYSKTPKRLSTGTFRSKVENFQNWVALSGAKPRSSGLLGEKIHASGSDTMGKHTERKALSTDLKQSKAGDSSEKNQEAVAVEEAKATIEE